MKIILATYKLPSVTAPYTQSLCNTSEIKSFQGSCPDLTTLVLHAKSSMSPPSNPLEELHSFDFHFSEARDSTMERLAAYAEEDFDDLKDSGSTAGNWRYIHVCKAGTVQIKDIFAFDFHDFMFEVLEIDDEGLTPLDFLSWYTTQ